MKVALVHDYLNQYGGAERVLEALLGIFPDADIYTLIYSRERSLGRFHRNLHKTSLLDLPLTRRNHRPFIPLMPLAMRSLQISHPYDLIISDSAGYAKGIRHPKGTYHLSYCYTPLRYAWETDHYFANTAFKTVFRPAFNYLRKWDFEASQQPDAFLAVSSFIAGKIRRYYGRKAEVVYPPVDYGRFYFDARLQPAAGHQDYYLAVGRLMHYKKFDLVLEGFLELGLPLTIAGVGPEQGRLRQRAAAAGNIRFLEAVPDDELRALYNGAKAFVFPQVEDFGLVAAEAQACGAPVIAFREGGALEIVHDGVTGVFFDSQTVPSLVEAVRRAENMRFDRAQIGNLSRRFTLDNFKQGVISHIPGSILGSRA